jgi:hypothetical protein
MRSHDDDGEEEALIDLSVDDINHEDSIPDIPQQITVTLHRESTRVSWGIFIQGNRKFPLTIGKVDERLSHLLQATDVIVAINEVEPESYDEAVQLYRASKVRMVLTILRAPPFSAGDTGVFKSATTKASGDVHAPSSTAADGVVATGFHDAKSSGNDVYAFSQRSEIPHKKHEHPSSSSSSTLVIEPMVLQQMRSNLDVVLKFIAKAPRQAVYDRRRCPLGESDGFTASFHERIQSQLTQNALGELPSTATAPHPKRIDVRHDAVAAAQGIGLNRIPDELIRDISMRSIDQQKRQESHQVSGGDAERAQSLYMSLSQHLAKTKKGAEETKRSDYQALKRRRVECQEALTLYQTLCGDEDDGVVWGNSSSSGGKSGGAFPRPNPSNSLFSQSYQLPRGLSATTFANHSHTTSGTTTSTGASGMGDVTVVTHVSKKKRKRGKGGGGGGGATPSSGVNTSLNSTADISGSDLTALGSSSVVHPPSSFTALSFPSPKPPTQQHSVPSTGGAMPQPSLYMFPAPPASRTAGAAAAAGGGGVLPPLFSFPLPPSASSAPPSASPLPSSQPSPPPKSQI